MSPMAVVIVMIFGFLIFAPVLAAWSTKVTVQGSSRSSHVVKFPPPQEVEDAKHRRETDAA